MYFYFLIKQCRCFFFNFNLFLAGDKSVNGDKGEEEPEIEDDEGEEEEDGPVYYDQKKSFFDNISCEATERSKGYSLIFENCIDFAIL